MIEPTTYEIKISELADLAIEGCLECSIVPHPKEIASGIGRALSLKDSQDVAEIEIVVRQQLRVAALIESAYRQELQ
jgi:hypothetical protein